MSTCTNESISTGTHQNIVSINAISSPCGGFNSLTKLDENHLIPDDTIRCLEGTLFWRYDPTSKMLSLLHKRVYDHCTALMTMDVIKDSNKFIIHQNYKRDPDFSTLCVCDFDLRCDIPEITGQTVTLELDTLTLTLNLIDQKGKIVLDPILSIDLDQDQFSNLSSLLAYSQLQQLWSVNTQKYTDLSPIGQLPNLMSLHCYNVDSIGFIATATKLSTLQLRATPALVDLSPLRNLNALSDLTISRASSLQDISPIGQCRDLFSLSIVNCSAITDFKPIGDCSSLVTLELSDCNGLCDLNSLSGLVNLHALSLSKINTITTLEPIANLTGLLNFSLDSIRGIKSLEPLRHLTQMLSLQITGNNLINDISPLSGLTSLIDLRLKDLPAITDFSPLLLCLGSRSTFMYSGLSIPQDILDKLRQKGVSCEAWE
jgi:hypothetical protein